MEPLNIEHDKKELQAQRKINWQKWLRIVLLFILGCEAAGALSGGILLIVAPDGQIMDMRVDIMHGVFRDFMIPGIILFGLGILNTAAFVTVIRKSRADWIMAGLALGGLLVWFSVEIAILQELHWLHIAWGMPVYLGSLVAMILFTSQCAATRKALLICGILSSLLYPCSTVAA